jgi:cytochrome c oxidase subunit 4
MAHAEDHHHIIPKKVLFTVFGVLVTLTVLTALTAQLNLGGFNVPLALAIAFTKAALVLAIFMALKYDNRVNTLVISIGAIFVGVFLLFTLFDTALRGSLGIMEPGVIETPALPSAPADTLDGAALFTTYLCSTCHSLDGTPGVGPSLQGVGSRRTREEVVQSIREPDAVVTEGFTAGIMSATLAGIGFADKISDEEFEALVDYLMAQK